MPIKAKAKDLGFQVDMPRAIAKMRQHGIWLSQPLIALALSHVFCQSFNASSCGVDIAGSALGGYEWPLKT